MGQFLVVGVEHYARGWAKLSYQTALLPCKELWTDSVQRNRCVVCVLSERHTRHRIEILKKCILHQRRITNNLQSGDIMVTLDRWSVYSLSRCAHTLDQVELDFSTRAKTLEDQEEELKMSKCDRYSYLQKALS